MVLRKKGKTQMLATTKRKNAKLKGGISFMAIFVATGVLPPRTTARIMARRVSSLVRNLDCINSFDCSKMVIAQQG